VVDNWRYEIAADRWTRLADTPIARLNRLALAPADVVHSALGQVREMMLELARGDDVESLSRPATLASVDEHDAQPSVETKLKKLKECLDKAEFRRRREAIVEGLNAIPGIRCAKPSGAFYVFPNITGLGMKSSQVEAALLEEAGVAALSGTAFGSNGEGYVRFSYANSIENIREGLKRFETFAQAHANVTR
jgi:bifunctional pyridoxal-dependent enzyme with beta-cystathionase and maltose regulon repressor activities